MNLRNNLGRPPLPQGERADSQIQLRVTRQRKASYVRAANKKKQTLAAWAFEALDREAIMPTK
jgi:predicted HicB family RNase H-like nuclease